MEWLALIIPLGIGVFSLYYLRHSIVWWEIGIPTIACILFISLFKVSAKHVMISDTEYWGSLIVKARYYEYWETYVHRTCTRTVSCGKNCTTTVVYDCSYCDTHPEKWVAYDNVGNSWSISRDYYEQLRKKWSSTPVFIDMNRSITRSYGCGVDGDAYEITWDNKIETSEAAVTNHTYTNKVQASHSAFKLETISSKDAKKLGLYDYPKYYNYYKQPVILGVNINDTKLQYFNGYYGYRNKVKVFIPVFFNKPYSISEKQQAYWDGGNQNEVIICVGLDSISGKIQWVNPFSFTDRKRLLVDIREDISQLQQFNTDSIYYILERNIGSSVVYKNFKKDFSYLRVELKRWQIIFIWSATLILSIGLTWVLVINDHRDYTSEDELNNIITELK